MFLRQVDAERKCVTGIGAPAKPVYPVVADPYAGRGQSLVTRECLVCSRIVVAPLEHHLASGIDNRAPALSVAAQRGGLASGVTDDNLLTVLSDESCPNW